MSMRLTLLCHAALARGGEIAFPADEPIDPVGLTSLPVPGRLDRLLSAPELRARQTAEAVGPAIVEPALRDCDYGTWRGRSLGDIGAADPEGAAAWIADPAVAPHGGESILDLLRRVGAWLDAGPETGHTVGVTHPAVIRAAVVHALGAPPSAFWRIDVEPLSIADLRHNAGRWTLRALGRP
ncbi:MAG TPA: histidine phosphatase family protein [Aliidongia sp.]|uniref:histidine phosphatase family protein n=1 Tax=Aliidongia sp. TaxID=1914230 RepID=UPI002DDCD9C5|nr:histidine phosphatase family protein [Aliidongia sp.]HEV2678324.1 histidine phosphatase family protein [Aliidongia sp.]